MPRPATPRPDSAERERRVRKRELRMAQLRDQSAKVRREYLNTLLKDPSPRIVAAARAELVALNAERNEAARARRAAEKAYNEAKEGCAGCPQ